MTEEQKQALIEEGNRILKHGYGTKKSDELIKIALAALTAPPVKVDDSMALAFHKALNEGGVGHEDLEEIKVGLEAALCNIPRHAPAADLAEMVPEEAIPDENACEWVDGWNACRAAILRKIEEAE